MFSSPVTRSRNPLRPRTPSWADRASVIVAAGNKGPLRHLLSQAASLLLLLFFPVMELTSKSSGRKIKQQQHQAKRSGRRGRWRLQTHPFIHHPFIHQPFTHHPPMMTTAAEVLAACPKSYSKSSWERVWRQKWKFVVTCAFCMIQLIKQLQIGNSCLWFMPDLLCLFWSSVPAMPPVWHMTSHQITSTNPGSA